MLEMKLLTLILIFLFLTGCMTHARNNDQQLVDEMVQESVYSVLAAKYKQNGANLFCDQKTYLICFDISQNQCQLDLQPYVAGCYEVAQKQIGASIDDNNVKEFSKFFGICMMSKHVKVHGPRLSSVEEFQKIGTCLEEIQFDERQIEKSLMGSEYEPAYEKYNQSHGNPRTRQRYITEKQQTEYLNKTLPRYLGIHEDQMQIEVTDSGTTVLTINMETTDEMKEKIENKIYNLRMKYRQLRPITVTFGNDKV